MRNLSFARPSTRQPLRQPRNGSTASGAAVLFRVLVALTIALVWGRGAVPVLASEPGGMPTMNEVVYYVDNQQEDASDQNTGFERGAPLRSVGVALARARSDILAGRAARIVIASGTYRESLTLNFSDQEPASGAALVIEAAEPGKVTISGSDVYADWQPLGAGVYAHPWPFKWGFAENPWTRWNVVMGPLALRREMVFVNGERLRQVLTDDDLRAAPMTFLVDEDGDRVLIHLPSGISPERALTEVSSRDHLLSIINGQNLTLRGLRFEHAATPLRSAAVTFRGSELFIDNCAFEFNSDTGFRPFRSSNVYIINSAFSHNGFHGISTVYTSLLSVEDSDISYNNWRGAMAEFYSWDPSNKQVGGKKQEWRRLRVVGNMGSGLWFDGIDGSRDKGNSDIVISESIFSGNAITGIDVEANTGPFSINNNVFCHNSYKQSAIFTPVTRPALLIWDSRSIDVVKNIFFDNYYFHIAMTHDDTRLFLQGIRVAHNKFITTKGRIRMLRTPFPSDKRHIEMYRNMYFVYTSAAPFLVVEKSQGLRETPGKELTFDAWRRETGQDQNSTWEEHAPDQIPQGCELRPAQ